MSNDQNTAGFTLLETLIAIGLLAVSITGPIVLATQGLSSAFFAKDQVTAFYLAQEGVEYVRSIRDENILQQRSWLYDLDGSGTKDACVDQTEPCIIDLPNYTHSSCPAGGCDKLRFNEVSNLYNQTAIGGSNIESPYTREVTITTVNSDEVSIFVTVSWTTGSKTHSFTIRENMFNWIQL